MRQQPQLDLRVVGLEQQVSRLGDKCGANLASQLGADGNVLQVGIADDSRPVADPAMLNVVCSRSVQEFSSAGSAST